MHAIPSPSRRFRWPLVAATALALGLVAAALQFSAPASADSSSCADAVTTAPTGPATVSAETKAPFGKVLVVGSGAYAGCSLYLLTSDQLHSLSGADFACSDNAERPGSALRHRSLAGASHRRRADRRPGGQPHPARHGDPHRRAVRDVGATGDVRGPAAVPVRLRRVVG